MPQAPAEVRQKEQAQQERKKQAEAGAGAEAEAEAGAEAEEAEAEGADENVGDHVQASSDESIQRFRALFLLLTQARPYQYSALKSLGALRL